jgi:hypothetical protein
MYDNKEIEERLVIIKNSGLDDVTILNKNYMYLIRDASDISEQAQLLTLQKSTKKRIKELETLSHHYS